MSAKTGAASSQAATRQTETRRRWLETLQHYQHDPDRPASPTLWSPTLDGASRDELVAIQNAKLAAAVPFLYENSAFYARRFQRLGMTPDDIRTVEDLPQWPVVDKLEMMEDAAAHPPYGTYSTMDDALWAERGWMLFASSGSSGQPRVFRYSQVDRELLAWANARALHAMGIGKGDTAFLVSGYGPHVWIWGVQFTLAKMGVPAIPGGGMDARARANVILRFQPTVLACTPSYALHLGRVVQDMGHDPAKTAIRAVFVAGEPAAGILNTRTRLEELWGARLVEFYGCTEASPHAGGFSCPESDRPGQPITTHLMEDVGVWELIDPVTTQPVAEGRRGITVCTNLNTESSPQLRFLVGDYTAFDRTTCACGRTHVRAMGSFSGRSDDLINLRGIKMYPTQIEEAVRAVPGIGDEYEIVLAAQADGIDTMTVRVEHAETAVASRVADEIRTRCEVRVDIEVLAPGTLPKTEFKAKRVRDLRAKS
jgi:phenylacetate-CoA ligase